MFRALIAATLLAGGVAILLTTGSVLAKGPFTLDVSGGDLVQPVTIDGPVAEGGMFGPEIADPQPHPDVIYTVEFFTMNGHRPAGSISYYPAHDGQPAAWRTKYGFYAVPGAFNDTFTAYLPSDDDGTSTLWYILPGAGLGLVMVAGGLRGRRLLSLRRD
jgi:hypothetical protein